MNPEVRGLPLAAPLAASLDPRPWQGPCPLAALSPWILWILASWILALCNPSQSELSPHGFFPLAYLRVA